MYTKSIPHFNKLLYTFCIQILTASIVLLILHTKCIQMFGEMWDTFCKHLVYILYTFCIHLVQFLYTKCTHDFHVGYYQTKENTFSEFMSNITSTLKELLPNNTTHFSRHQAIQHFHRVPSKLN